MKNTFKYFIALLSMGLISSCEKAIDLQLKDTTPQYVIEGVLTDEAGGCRVLVSQTKNFTDNNDFAGINGAEVSITLNSVVYPLAQTGAGIYTNNTLTGTPDNTYNLTVKVDGKVFTSASKMPPAIPLDSIYLVKNNFSDNDDGSDRKFVNVRYKDPQGIKNYYRFVQYLNKRKEDVMLLDFDEYTDGQVVNSLFRYINENEDPARDIRPGNEVTIEMMAIEPAVYTYFFSLVAGATGDDNNAAPSNPVTNIKGGALGYFSAHTVRRKTLIAP